MFYTRSAKRCGRGCIAPFLQFLKNALEIPGDSLEDQVPFLSAPFLFSRTISLPWEK
jgi:hypothetical protein